MNCTMITSAEKSKTPEALAMPTRAIDIVTEQEMSHGGGGTKSLKTAALETVLPGTLIFSRVLEGGGQNG